MYCARDYMKRSKSPEGRYEVFKDGADNDGKPHGGVFILKIIDNVSLFELY